MFYKMNGAEIHGNITIGDESSIWYNAVLRGDNGSITIGEKVNIQDGCVCHASPSFPLTVGDKVTVGHRAILHGCTIEEECLIGMGAIIMNGAYIQKHCIVGAGSLVTENKKFEEGTLILGSPAKAIRKLTKEEIQSIQKSAEEYVLLARNKKKE